MQNLEFVNNCGDEFTSIPEHFVPDISKANGMAVFCIIVAGAQAGLVFVLMLTCVLSGKSEDDDSDDEIDYEKLEQNDQQNDYQV